jgi:hypothetical protein
MQFGNSERIFNISRFKYPTGLSGKKGMCAAGLMLPTHLNGRFSELSPAVPFYPSPQALLMIGNVQ